MIMRYLYGTVVRSEWNWSRIAISQAIIPESSTTDSITIFFQVEMLFNTVSKLECQFQRLFSMKRDSYVNSADNC